MGSACGIDEWHLEQLAQLVMRIEPIRVSDHACFARGQLAGATNGMVHAADLLPVPFNDAALDVMCRNVQRVQERIGRPLLVENLSAYVTLQGSDRDETSFLVELAQRTGCGLLVDINNIYVNALNQRLAGCPEDPIDACRNWLDNIPSQLVGELHVAGHLDCGDIVIDDHGSCVGNAVWALYHYALQRFGAVPVLVEWDTDVPPLQVLLDEVNRARITQIKPGRLAAGQRLSGGQPDSRAWPAGRRSKAGAQPRSSAAGVRHRRKSAGLARGFQTASAPPQGRRTCATACPAGGAHTGSGPDAGRSRGRSKQPGRI